MEKGLTARALWRHYPLEEFHTEKFSEAAVAFQQAHGFDLVKVTPRSSFCLRDYGCEDTFQGDELGRPHYIQSCVTREGWKALSPLDPSRGYLKQQLDCLEGIAERLGIGAPIFQTVFSPLTQAKNLCPLTSPLWREGNNLHHALEVLAESTRRFVASLPGSTLGIYYVISEAGDIPIAYSDFIRRIDTSLLESFPRMRMLHLHGRVSNFRHFCTYPVSILHWDEKLAGTSLEDGKTLFPGTVAGGIDWPLEGWPNKEALLTQCRKVCERVGPDRFLLSPSCVIPYETPAEMIQVFRLADC